MRSSSRQDPERPTIAVLGTGRMGAPIVPQPAGGGLPGRVFGIAPGERAPRLWSRDGASPRVVPARRRLFDAAVVLTMLGRLRRDRRRPWTTTCVGGAVRALGIDLDPDGHGGRRLDGATGQARRRPRGRLRRRARLRQQPGRPRTASSWSSPRDPRASARGCSRSSTRSVDRRSGWAGRATAGRIEDGRSTTGWRLSTEAPGRDARPERCAGAWTRTSRRRLSPTTRWPRPCGRQGPGR